MTTITTARASPDDDLARLVRDINAGPWDPDDQVARYDAAAYC